MVLRKIIDTETHVLDARAGIVEYVASDETLDHSGEVMRANGWRFTHFRKHAPFVDSHDYESIEKCLGKVLAFAVVNNKRLVETVQWAINVPENRLAQFGWKMTAAGFLRAVSVGFKPVRVLTPQSKGWAAELAALKLAADDRVKRIYIEQEQIELSAVLMGENPNALSRSYKGGMLAALSRAYRDGVITESDVDYVGAAVAGVAGQYVRKQVDRNTPAQARARFLDRFEKALRR